MATATFVQDGQTIDYTPVAEVPAGGVVVIEGFATLLFGVAKVGIPAGTLGAISLEGVYDLPKGNEAFALGRRVSWDTANDVASGEVGSYIGTCVKAAAAGDATVRVRLLPQLGTGV